jgi:hypothetical protein
MIVPVFEPAQLYGQEITLPAENRMYNPQTVLVPEVTFIGDWSIQACSLYNYLKPSFETFDILADNSYRKPRDGLIYA